MIHHQQTKPQKGGTLSLTEQSRQQQAYEEIRHRILDGKLLPSTPLSEYQLAAQLEISRTPVREALKRLEHEGLIRSYPGRGAFVVELSTQDIIEIYQIRSQLEGFAARVAAEQMVLDDIQLLERDFQQFQALTTESSEREAFELDIHLHKKIIGSTKNSRLITILATLDDQVHRIRAMSSRAPGRLEAALHEHREIVERIKQRDAVGAEQAMLHHLQAACENALRLVAPSRLSYLSFAQTNNNLEGSKQLLQGMEE